VYHPYNCSRSLLVEYEKLLFSSSTSTSTSSSSSSSSFLSSSLSVAAASSLSGESVVLNEAFVANVLSPLKNENSIVRQFAEQDGRLTINIIYKQLVF